MVTLRGVSYQHVDPRFDTSNALTMSVVLAIEKIRAVPGAISVGTYYEDSGRRRWIDTTLQYRRLDFKSPVVMFCESAPL